MGSTVVCGLANASKERVMGVATQLKQSKNKTAYTGDSQ